MTPPPSRPDHPSGPYPLDPLASWDPDHQLGLDKPNVARVYDHLLGGNRTLSLDRQTADELSTRIPEALLAARASHRFLAHATATALGRGIDQFIDLGCGLLSAGGSRAAITAGNAGNAGSPRARLLLVDSDPIAATHTAHACADEETIGVVHADLRHVDEILDHPQTQRLIDPRRPVAILLTAVLHFVPGNLAPTLATYRWLAPPASLLAISHATPIDDPRAAIAAEIYSRTPTPLAPRTQAEVAALFGDWTPLAGGLAPITTWPDAGRGPIGPGSGDPLGGGFLAGMAVKPLLLRQAHSNLRRVPPAPRVPRVLAHRSPLRVS